MVEKPVRKFVGVVPVRLFAKLGHAKQMLLMFESLALDLKDMTSEDRTVAHRAMREIDWLARAELLTLLSGLHASQDMHPTRAALNGARRTLSGISTNRERLRALELRRKGVDAVPILENKDLANLDAKASREAVICIAVKQFPIPSDETPWDCIQDFKRDAGAVTRYWRLRAWINDVANKGLTIGGIEDELQHLIAEYEASLRAHKIKHTYGALEIALTSSAELIEDVLKMNLSAASKRLFSARSLKVELLEDEQNRIGKEVGYILQARQAFA